MNLEDNAAKARALPLHNPLPVAGYRPQSDEKIQIVNANKMSEEALLRQLDQMKAEAWVDQRWLAIGRTKLEEAFMAVNRAIFQPSRIALPGDQIPTPPAQEGKDE